MGQCAFEGCITVTLLTVLKLLGLLSLASILLSGMHYFVWHAIEVND